MKPLGRALQVLENRKKEVFAGLNKIKMTDEQLKKFCSVFLGDDTDNFLLMCDKIESDEAGFISKQKRITSLWLGFIGYKLMDLDFLNEVKNHLKKIKEEKKNSIK